MTLPGSLVREAKTLLGVRGAVVIVGAVLFAGLSNDQVFGIALLQYAPTMLIGPIWVSEVWFVFLAVFTVWFGAAGLVGGFFGIAIGGLLAQAQLGESIMLAGVSVVGALPPLLVERGIGRRFRVDEPTGFLAFVAATVLGHEGAELVLRAINEGQPFVSRVEFVKGALLAAGVIGYPILWLFTSWARRVMTPSLRRASSPPA